MNMALRTLRNPIGWSLLLILAVLICASVFAIVPESQQALVVRLGDPIRVVNAYARGATLGESGAGLIARVPFIEQVVYVDKRVRTLELDKQTIVTADHQARDVSASASYRVVDPLRLYRSSGGDQTRLATILRPALATALRDGLAGLPADALLGRGRAPALARVRDALDRIAQPYGVQVIDVRIERIGLPDGAPLDGAFDRMRQDEQQAAAAVHAEGLKRAAEIRADADAQSTRTFAQAYGQDPDFYEFYRAMQSYRQTFGVDQPAQGSTTMVLSPDSDYLRFLKSKGR